MEEGAPAAVFLSPSPVVVVVVVVRSGDLRETGRGLSFFPWAIDGWVVVVRLQCRIIGIGDSV